MLKESGGILIYDKRMLETPQTCIILNKRHNSRFLVLQEFCKKDLVAVKLKYDTEQGKHEVIICSAYFPGETHRPPPTEEVQQLIQYAHEENIQLILGCDANAHHVVWNSTNTNERGEHLLDYMVSNNLILLNQGNRPTFVTVSRKEVLDITMCTQHISNSIKKWEVLKEPSMADHQHIYFEVEGHGKTQEIYRDPRRTDWKKFRQSVEDNTGPVNTNIYSHKQLDEYADHLQDILKSAY